MDYSKLSDSDISHKVWFWWNSNVDHDDSICAAHGSGVLYVKDERWVAFDPCRSWSDAGPIIAEHGISLVRQAGEVEWCASSKAFWVDGNEWQIDGTWNDNPLRAAMIVFLMMQEGKDDSKSNPAPAA